MDKTYYFTNIFPHYRKPIWKAIIESKDLDVTFFYSKSNPLGIKQTNDLDTLEWLNNGHINENKGYWIFNKFLIWQSNVLKRCLIDSFDSIILLGDMYVLSNWLLAIIARLRGKKVIFWSHGLYGNELIIKKVFRLNFYKLANFHLVYENRAKQLLLMHGFKENRVKVIYNSLDYAIQKDLYFKLLKVNNNPFHFFENNDLPVFIYSGRLSKSKKIDLLIEAITHLNLKGQICNLLIVGDGPERKNLLFKAHNLIKSKSIFFYGECYEEKILASFFYNSICTISPGNVGLTGIHSFSYGTPVITHNNFKNQMPEVEAIIEGENGFFFIENNIKSLILTIKKILTSNINFKNNCRKVIDNKYNPDYQVNILKNILNA